MVDSNFYVENPANSAMHYGDKPVVGVLDFPDKLPIKRPYNYFEGEALYYNLQKDIYETQHKAKPKKKGIPSIIKIGIGLIAGGLALKLGVQGISQIIGRFKKP